MDYKLAKELKDAGFPQEPNGQVDEVFGDTRHSEYILWKEDACSPTVIAGTDDYKNGIRRGDNLVKRPTLSELIEACGDEFKKMWRHSDGSWSAFSGTRSQKNILKSSGATPEIAVAKLWLALHANK